MEKFIILLFFFVAIGIFSFLKLASRGIREGYNHVNYLSRSVIDSKSIANDKSDFDVVKSVIGILDVQRALIFDEHGKFPPQAEGRFSWGYVAGFTNVFLVKANIINDARSFALIAIVFYEIFGPAKGPDFSGLFLEDQAHAVTRAGFASGARDALDFSENCERIPLSWLNYVDSQRT